MQILIAFLHKYFLISNSLVFPKQPHSFFTLIVEYFCLFYSSTLSCSLSAKEYNEVHDIRGSIKYKYNVTFIYHFLLTI